MLDSIDDTHSIKKQKYTTSKDRDVLSRKKDGSDESDTSSTRWIRREQKRGRASEQLQGGPLNPLPMGDGSQDNTKVDGKKQKELLQGDFDWSKARMRQRIKE